MVYKKHILLTMSEQSPGKLNRLLEHLGDADLVSSRWLRANGYGTSLVARYVHSGWLVSPARGAYMRAGAKPSWDGVLYSLQQHEGLSLHAGGRFALTWFGHAHYLEVGAPSAVDLYGPDRLPPWANRLGLAEQFHPRGKGPFAAGPSSLGASTPEEDLYAFGLERHADSSMVGEVVFSSPERAILELCDGTPGAALAYEADAAIQGLAGLRPELASRLLQQCRSIKAKRLFLALADRHEHPWFARLELGSVELGSGKRMFVPGGRMNAKYGISLPTDLDEQLG